MNPLPKLPTIRRHDGRSRYYTVEGHEGRAFPSVTTILGIINKPALIPWSNKQGRLAMAEVLSPYVGDVLTEGMIDDALTAAAKRPKEILEAAGDYGTQAHILIERMVKGEKVIAPPEFAPTVDAFLGWWGQAGIRLKFSERMVYSDQHGYAGGMDCFGERGELLVALDWKTSGGIWPEAAAQVAAYAMAWEEMIGQRANEAWVIRLAKVAPPEGQSGFEAKRVNIPTAFEMFLAAKRLYDASKGQVYLPDKPVEETVKELWG